MLLSWAVAGHANDEAQTSRPAMHVLLGVKAEFPAGTPHNTFPNVVWNEEGRLNPSHGYRWAAEGLYSYDVVRIVSGTSDDTYPNVVRDAEGTLQPAPGYQWIDDNLDNYEVQAVYPGAPHFKYPHVVWDAEGSLEPAPGYQWINDNLDNYEVQAIYPGAPHYKYPNVVYTADGNLDPASGFEWTSNDPDDFTVIATVTDKDTEKENIVSSGTDGLEHVCVSRDQDNLSPYSIALKKGYVIKEVYRISFPEMELCASTLVALQTAKGNTHICASRDNDGLGPWAIFQVDLSRIRSPYEKTNLVLYSLDDCKYTISSKSTVDGTDYICASKDGDGLNPFGIFRVEESMGSSMVSQAFSSFEVCLANINEEPSSSQPSTHAAGTPHDTYPNVVYTADGNLDPAPGYEWASNDPDDFTVIVTGSNSDTSTPSAGTPHDTYPNVVYTADGNLDPAPGYEWASNDPDDFTVIVTGSRAANELVCDGYSANSERAVFVDCSNRRAVIDILGKAWQTLRENQIEGDTEDLCWDPYQSAKELHPSIEVTHIAPTWFFQCNMALQYVQ
jgi:hypothetical protein